MTTIQAQFCKDDPRHAIVEDQVYPVLFSENIAEGWYEENIEDSGTYPTGWANAFRADLVYKGAAVIAEYVDYRHWVIRSLFSISDVEVFRSIKCRVGEKLLDLEEA
jgi:hypothetical protein